MSCPNWRGLLAARERGERRGELDPPSGWRSAVDHLAGCPACRIAAFELDPTLLFVAQAPLDVSDRDVEEIKIGVRTLRRARAAERAAGEPRRRLGRVAAAAAAVSLLILLPTHTTRQPVVAPRASGPGFVAGASALDRPADGPAPVIEPLGLPLARIYQLGEEDLSVVMVVDESIDV